MRVQAEVDAGRIETVSAETVVEEALKFQDTWPTLDVERKPQVVQSLVESISVDAAAPGITLRFTCCLRQKKLQIPNSGCDSRAGSLQRIGVAVIRPAIAPCRGGSS